jgi:hypothetical protein
LHSSSRIPSLAHLFLCTSAAALVAACGGGSDGQTTAATSGSQELPKHVRTSHPARSAVAEHTLEQPAAALASGAPRAVPSPIYGVTIDDISGLSNIVQSLSSLSKTPTTRIVFDEFVAPSYYRAATVAINKVSYVMGELLDSFYVKTVNVQGYLNRTAQYLNTLGDVVDIWEVGNEINGEWLGTNSAVVAKMSGAYDMVKAQNKTAALTLYYNQDCWSRPSNEMFTWAQTNIPVRMKQGLDYVFVSYYEDDCNGLKPDWPAVFSKLSKMFPNSKIGFGEVGTARAAKKADYLTRYYTMDVNVPNYVGGHFWWYFKQDMVPSTKPLWKTLNSVIANQ